MASRAQPSASSAVWPNMTSLGSSAIVSTTPDGSVGSTLIRYLVVMGRLPPFVVRALKIDEPLRAAERGAPTVAYPAVVANITGNPAMSVPLWWSDSGSPIGVHFLAR